MPSRIVAAVCGLICLYVALRATIAVIGGQPLFVGTALGAVTAAALAGWFAVSAHSGVANIQWWRTARMALIVGGFMFVAGYVVPLLTNPDESLGPLIGVFGTGPAGFALGALVGLVAAFRDRDTGI